MKANDINSEYTYKGKMLIYPKEHQRYRDSAKLGKVFPTTDSQRKFIGEKGYYFDILGLGDVEEIEKVLQEHGLQGDYLYTKGKSFVRLSIFSNARLLKIFSGKY